MAEPLDRVRGLIQAGDLEGAESACRAVLEGSRCAEGLNLLAAVLLKKQRLAEAAACLREAIGLDPSHVPAHQNLGVALLRSGDFAGAEASFREALRLAPNHAGALSSLGDLLQQRSRLAEAIPMLARAAELEPGRRAHRERLVQALVAAGQWADVERLCDEAIATLGASDDLVRHRAVAVARLGRCVQAEAQLAAHPSRDVNVLHEHARILCWMGDVEASLEKERQAIEIAPRHLASRQGRLFSLGYTLTDDQTIAEEHRRFGRLFPAAPRCPRRPRGSRLRVGYISSEFSHHPVGYFLRGLVNAHDPDRVEVHCYSGVAVADEVTDHIRRGAQHWTEISGLPTPDLARRIYEDRIDVLVDLSGHTDTLLAVFSFCPAPVQVSYLGYHATTGLDAIHWRLTEEMLDPTPAADALYTERLFRIEGPWCTYTPPAEVPEPGDPPCLARGYVTFCSFNQPPKMSDAIVRLWAEVLRRVPNSRLRIRAIGMGEAAGAARFTERLARLGIPSERLELRPFEHMRDYLADLMDCDIALDTFPFNGHTNTCHGLWVGVPAVSLVGEACRSRMGLALLSRVGLADLAATSPDGFVEAAVALASDPPRLRTIRRSLRERVRDGPLGDHQRLARRIEDAFHRMWEQA